MGLVLNFLNNMNPPIKRTPANKSTCDILTLNHEAAFPLNSAIKRIDNPADAISETTAGLKPFKAPCISHKS